MTDDEILTLHFPGTAARLSELRRSDRTIAEICSDLVDMHRDFTAVTGCPPGPRLRHAADIAEAMAGLRAEILGRLDDLSASANREQEG